MDLAKFIESTAAKGRYHFTTDEASKALNVSRVAARAAIRRMRARGGIAMPYRGFNVIVPPEYRRLGCLPPEQFIPQLMEHLGLKYYIGLLSAAAVHGAAHQRPQVFQVVIPPSRPRIRCGETQVQFVARRNAEEIPTLKKNTPRGYMTVASPEATAFDLVGYVHRCGGLGNVATVLAELAEILSAEGLVAIAPLSPVPWAQRLGHLLEVAGAASIAGPLATHVARTAREYVPLSLKRQDSRYARSVRWKLIVNDIVRPDL
jgi:predicted transcriptional regulator of viral defense system